MHYGSAPCGRRGVAEMLEISISDIMSAYPGLIEDDLKIGIFKQLHKKPPLVRGEYCIERLCI